MRDLLKRTILFCSVVAFASTLCCCNVSDDVNDTQREKIVSYLESRHTPNLIAETDISLSLDSNPQFYSVFPSYIYRYISTYYDADRANRTEVDNLSRVTLTFDLFEFTGSNISESELPFYTNNPLYKDKLVEAGLTIVDGVNNQMWNFTPMSFQMGSDELLTSIQEALIGCHEGDYIEIYLTYKAAYNRKIIGLIEKEAPLVFRCTIDAVEN